MRTVKDVEAYLERLRREYSAVDASAEPQGRATFIVRSAENMPSIAVRVDPPLVVVRVHVGDLGKKDNPPLLRSLLQLNAKELVHASYGLDDSGRILLSAALELENLDFNELEAALDEIDIALASQVPELMKLGAGHQ